MPNNRDANGGFRRNPPPADNGLDSDDSGDVVREYRVSLPAFVLWPVNVIAWLIATVLRFVALILLVAALVALWGWYQGHDATAPPATVSPAMRST